MLLMAAAGAVDDVVFVVALPDGERLALDQRNFELVGKEALDLGGFDPVEIFENAAGNRGVETNQRAAGCDANGREYGFGILMDEPWILMSSAARPTTPAIRPGSIGHGLPS